jgi:hypothetical protein
MMQPRRNSPISAAAMAVGLVVASATGSSHASLISIVGRVRNR